MWEGLRRPLESGGVWIEGLVPMWKGHGEQVRAEALRSARDIRELKASEDSPIIHGVIPVPVSDTQVRRNRSLRHKSQIHRSGHYFPQASHANMLRPLFSLSKAQLAYAPFSFL